MTVEIAAEYHPKIIGRRGAVITKLRQDYDVNIQLPRKEDPNQTLITITGFEQDANKARAAILKIVEEFVSDRQVFKYRNRFCSWPFVMKEEPRELDLTKRLKN